MRQNPCRYCALSFVYKGGHYKGGNPTECLKCENIKKHEEYLLKQRKFIEGETITSLEELLQQEWVMWYHTTRHIEIFKHNQLKTVLGWLNAGAFKKAIRKESEDK